MQSSVGSRAFQNARLQKQARKQAEVLLPAAVNAYRQARHGEAQALCRQILKDLPNHFDALHLFGVSEVDCGHFEEAVAALTQAVSIDPRSAEAQSNLGMALFRLNRYEEAHAAQQKAIALKPNFATALTNLGNTLMHMRRLEESIAAHDRAVALKPGYGDAYCNRGMTLLLLERNEEADRDFDRALSFSPRLQAALLGKGLVNLNLRNFDVALEKINAAVAANPNAAPVLAQRGRVFQQMAQLEKANADFEAALALDPGLEAALCGKANLGLLNGNIAPAIAACNKVLARNPNSEVAITLLGSCAAKQGEIATAVALYDRALEIKPDYEEAISKKIFAMDFLPGVDIAQLQAARKSWWHAIGSKLPRRQLGECNLDPDRRIVVGYISSDFREHSAALAFMPILRRHDHEKFGVILYSCSPRQDAITEVFRKVADKFVDASQFSDDMLADRIEADRVDILVDLSGHSAGHRLCVFARKPAPIQITAIGNATGTGLPVIDYFLTDPVAVPPGDRHLFAEKPYDLPSLITIEPTPGDVRPSAELPMLRNGHVTFGMFNRTDKISDPALVVWSKLMQAIPGSVIMVKNGAMSDAVLRDGVIARFVAHGIRAERVRCIGATPRRDHLAMFAEIDMALDPFPQNGGISTWEPLQMGVPVITKLGSGPAARAGGAIVKAVGLDDFVAEDDEGYIAIAQRFAADPAALAAVRARLPAMVANSAGGNSDIYIRHVEEGYRKFWRDYCASQGR